MSAQLGILAGFDDEGTLDRALARLAAAEIDGVETHTPAPLDGDQGGSAIPLVILAGGCVGTIGTFLLEVYATSVSYPMNIGGRPDFAWPAYVPLAFEFGVLSAVATGFVAFLVANRLPRLYAPIDEIEVFRRATRDGYFLAIRGDDTRLQRARRVLAECGPATVTELPA